MRRATKAQEAVSTKIRSVSSPSASSQPLSPREESKEILVPGDLIAGRYRIEKTLEGGFGRVFLSRTRDEEGLFALKTIRRKHLASRELKENDADCIYIRAMIHVIRIHPLFGRHVRGGSRSGSPSLSRNP